VETRTLAMGRKAELYKLNSLQRVGTLGATNGTL
jgi:hypothetical protein